MGLPQSPAEPAIPSGPPPARPGRHGWLGRMLRSRAAQLGIATFSGVAVIVGFANDLFGLLGDPPPPPPPSPTALIEIERNSLLLANEWAYQPPLGVYTRQGSTTSSQLRWRALLSIANTSATPMVIHDVETIFPKKDGAELHRVDKAKTITVFRDRADWSAVNSLDGDAERDARFAHSQPLPLILQSGQRLIIDYEQAFEYRRDGQAVTFAADDRSLVEAVRQLVPMNPLGGGDWQCPFGAEFDTVVRTTNGEIRKNLSYVLLVVGCKVIIPSQEEVKRLRQNQDDPLGDG